MDSMGVPEAPWHAAFPAPTKKEPGTMTQGEVLQMIKDCENEAGKDYLLVDLRKNDYQVRFSSH